MDQKTGLNPPKPLSRPHIRESFDCGVEALNEYIKKYALQSQKKDAARTYVVVDESFRVAGYYTLVFGSISPNDAPADVSHGLGRYPIPLILLARLAVDNTHKGIGLGKAMLRDALLRALHAADIAGLRAFMVHAKDKQAMEFYKRFGFAPAPTNELHLFRKIVDIRASIE